MRWILRLGIVVMAMSISACATAPTPHRPESVKPVVLPEAKPLAASPARSEEEIKVVASAKVLIGELPNAKVIVKGKEFVLDCIGTVSAIFYRLDIDVTKDFGKYSGNGVNRLYMTLKDRGVLHRDKYPRVGDVIVWDNTWDANDDGDRTDDPRTHAGVVMAVDEDGTIHYVHENMFKGVMVEVMNLLRPAVASDEAGKRINSSLAIATKTGGSKPEHWLAGDVFNAFGDVLKIESFLRVSAVEGEMKAGALIATLP